MRVYHNTFLRRTPVFRNNYLFGLGVGGMRDTERDVFNNLFVQMDQVPGVNFVALKEAPKLREGGNLLWGVQAGPTLKGDPFAKFRASPLFKQSRQWYEVGWTTHDRVADPKFVRLAQSPSGANDLRLQPGSPAIDAGQSLPEQWPDPLHEADKGEPDIGALPVGAKPWGVGVDGRLSLFGGVAK
jgi:hypothetical protein